MRTQQIFFPLYIFLVHISFKYHFHSNFIFTFIQILYKSVSVQKESRQLFRTGFCSKNELYGVGSEFPICYAQNLWNCLVFLRKL